MAPAKFPLGCPRCIMSPEGRRQLRIVPVVHLVPVLFPLSYFSICVVVTCPESNSVRQPRIVLKSVSKKKRGLLRRVVCLFDILLKKKGQRERKNEWIIITLSFVGGQKFLWQWVSCFIDEFSTASEHRTRADYFVKVVPSWWEHRVFFNVYLVKILPLHIVVDEYSLKKLLRGERGGLVSTSLSMLYRNVPPFLELIRNWSSTPTCNKIFVLHCMLKWISASFSLYEEE